MGVKVSVPLTPSPGVSENMDSPQAFSHPLNILNSMKLDPVHHLLEEVMREGDEEEEGKEVENESESPSEEEEEGGKGEEEDGVMTEEEKEEEAKKRRKEDLRRLEEERRKEREKLRRRRERKRREMEKKKKAAEKKKKEEEDRVAEEKREKERNKRRERMRKNKERQRKGQKKSHSGAIHLSESSRDHKLWNRLHHKTDPQTQEVIAESQMKRERKMRLGEKQWRVPSPTNQKANFSHSEFGKPMSSKFWNCLNLISYFFFFSVLRAKVGMVREMIASLTQQTPPHSSTFGILLSSLSQTLEKSPENVDFVWHELVSSLQVHLTQPPPPNPPPLPTMTPISPTQTQDLNRPTSYSLDPSRFRGHQSTLLSPSSMTETHNTAADLPSPISWEWKKSYTLVNNASKGQLDEEVGQDALSQTFPEGKGRRELMNDKDRTLEEMKEYVDDVFGDDPSLQAEAESFLAGFCTYEAPTSPMTPPSKRRRKKKSNGKKKKKKKKEEQPITNLPSTPICSSGEYFLPSPLIQHLSLARPIIPPNTRRPRFARVMPLLSRFLPKTPKTGRGKTVGSQVDDMNSLGGNYDEYLGDEGSNGGMRDDSSEEPSSARSMTSSQGILSMNERFSFRSSSSSDQLVAPIDTIDLTSFLPSDLPLDHRFNRNTSFDQLEEDGGGGGGRSEENLDENQPQSSPPGKSFSNKYAISESALKERSVSQPTSTNPQQQISQVDSSTLKMRQRSKSHTANDARRRSFVMTGRGLDEEEGDGRDDPLLQLANKGNEFGYTPQLHSSNSASSGQITPPPSTSPREGGGGGQKILSFLNPFKKKRDSKGKSSHEEHTMINSRVSWVNIEERDVKRRHSLGGDGMM